MISTRQLCLATATKAATVFLIAVALVALVARPSSAQTLNPGRSIYVAGLLKPAAAAGGGDACSSCTNETFEGVGTAVAGWKYGDNSAGVVTNVNYATAPAPLNGSQSLLIRNPDSQAGYLNLTVPSSAEVWIRMMINITNTVVSNMRLLTVEDNVGARMAELRIVGGALRVVAGTATATTVNTLSANTLTYVWFHHLKGSGANGVTDVGFGTSKTRPTGGNGFAQLTTGSTTANVVDFYLNVSDFNFGSGISGVIYDDVSFTQLGVIGDFP